MAQTNAEYFYETIKAAQNNLAEWILPDSKTTDKDVLSELLGILDSQELVKRMKEVEITANPIVHVKYWLESPNVEKTSYSETSLRVKYKNGYEFEYDDVPFEIWKGLLKTKSIGSFLHNNIKGNFSYHQVRP